jgi:hypothetical protein
MPYKVNKPEWAEGVRSYNNTNKRLLISTKVAVKAANKAKKA